MTELPNSQDLRNFLEKGTRAASTFIKITKIELMSIPRLLLFSSIAILNLIPCRASNPTPRADYVRATLPYETACLLQATILVRHKTQGDLASVSLLEQTLLEDFLRLHICLNDPSISDEDKKYAKDVMPHVLAYVQAHDIAKGYIRGKVYTMLADDIALPNTMKIRDVYENIIATSPKNP